MSNGKQSFTQQSWIGIVVIVIGGLFLLQSLGIGHFGRFLAQWWPAIIVAIGLFKMRNDDRRGGLIILIVGLVFLSITLHIINWGQIFRFWPVIIILIGLSMYLQATGRNGLSLVKRDESAEDTINMTTFFGGMTRNITSKDFKTATMFCMFGGVELDLRQAETKEESCVINVTAFFGGAEIYIPNGWRVNVKGTPIFGGIEDKTGDPGEGNPVVNINVTTAFGGVEIHN